MDGYGIHRDMFMCLENFRRRRRSLFWLVLFVVGFFLSRFHFGAFTNMKSCQHSNLFGSNGFRLVVSIVVAKKTNNAQILKLCFFSNCRLKSVAKREKNPKILFFQLHTRLFVSECAAGISFSVLLLFLYLLYYLWHGSFDLILKKNKR